MQDQLFAFQSPKKGLSLFAHLLRPCALNCLGHPLFPGFEVTLHVSFCKSLSCYDLCSLTRAGSIEKTKFAMEHSREDYAVTWTFKIPILSTVSNSKHVEEMYNWCLSLLASTRIVQCFCYLLLSFQCQLH